jgi:ABC-2 type transport system permease protein
VLLSGLFVPRSDMARWLQLLSDALPLTYAYDALARVTLGLTLGGRFALDLCVTIGATLLALALGAATLRRRTE